RRAGLLAKCRVGLVADHDRVGIRDAAGVADEPLIGLDRHQPIGIVTRSEQRPRDAIRITAVTQLPEKLIDEVAAVRENQGAARTRCLDEAERSHRLAGPGRMLEPEAPFRARVLRSVGDIISESITIPWGLWQLREAVGYRYPSGRIFNSPICYGQNDADRFAFLDFFSNIVGFRDVRDLLGLLRIVSSCGFFWPGLDKVAFFERPSLLRFDDQRRPHCLDGPAIQFPGGFTAYAIHGVPVPSKYIETAADEIDLAEVLAEQNAEVRMAVISKVGFQRLLRTVEPNNELQAACPHCGKRSTVAIPGRILQKKHFSPNIARVLSRANGNSLIELTIGRRPREESRRD
ncbi:hypothetical protein LCGC14_3094780, partial [marine sediment metagenome]